MDLLEELKKRTTEKLPSAAASKSWDFSDKETTDTIAPNDFTTQQPTPQTQTQATTKASEPKSENKLDAKTIKMDSEASQAAVEFLTTMIGEVIVNLMYRSKFSMDERQQLSDKVLDAKEENLNDEEKQLLRKYKRLMKEKDKKIDKLTPSDKARERMTDAFAKYAEMTGKTFFTPGMMLGVAIGESVIKTTTSVIFD